MAESYVAWRMGWGCERSPPEGRRTLTDVDTSAARPLVLVLGLDPYRVPGPWDPKPVADAIEVGMARLEDRGYDAEACLVGLDGSDDIEAVIGTALRAQQWECVLVGGGLRRTDDELGIFESIINLVHREAPRAAIAFNSTPQDLDEAVARHVRPHG